MRVSAVRIPPPAPLGFLLALSRDSLGFPSSPSRYVRAVLPHSLHFSCCHVHKNHFIYLSETPGFASKDVQQKLPSIGRPHGRISEANSRVEWPFKPSEAFHCSAARAIG